MPAASRLRRPSMKARWARRLRSAPSYISPATSKASTCSVMHRPMMFLYESNVAEYRAAATFSGAARPDARKRTVEMKISSVDKSEAHT